MCGESRMHGSEGGQGFLRVRLSYPTKRRGSAACQDKAPKGETLSYLRVSVRHVWQKLDCLKPSSEACIQPQRRKESWKAVSDE